MRNFPVVHDGSDIGFCFGCESVVHGWQVQVAVDPWA